MTRARTDAAHAEPEAKPKPYPIGLFRRYQLRRLGRFDGRLAMPDPRGAKVPLTTTARDQLRADHKIRVITLWETYRAEHATPDPEIQQIDNGLPALRQAVATAIRELTAAQESPPDPNNPQFSPGERRQHRSTEVVSKRRVEEHQQRISDLEKQRDVVAGAVARSEERRAVLVAVEAKRLGVVVLTEHRLIATFEYERTIYDGALQRRHPLRDLLRGKLDLSVPELSPWARAASNQRGE